MLNCLCSSREKRYDDAVREPETWFVRACGTKLSVLANFQRRGSGTSGFNDHDLPKHAFMRPDARCFIGDWC